LKGIRFDGQDLEIVRDDFDGDETDPRCYVANIRGLEEITIGINADWSGTREEMTF
jgi:hypothetical protein